MRVWFKRHRTLDPKIWFSGRLRSKSCGRRVQPPSPKTSSQPANHSPHASFPNAVVLQCQQADLGRLEAEVATVAITSSTTTTTTAAGTAWGRQTWRKWAAKSSSEVRTQHNFVKSKFIATPLAAGRQTRTKSAPGSRASCSSSAGFRRKIGSRYEICSNVVTINGFQDTGA